MTVNHAIAFWVSELGCSAQEAVERLGGGGCRIKKRVSTDGLLLVSAECFGRVRTEVMTDENFGRIVGHGPFIVRFTNLWIYLDPALDELRQE